VPAFDDDFHNMMPDPETTRPATLPPVELQPETEDWEEGSTLDEEAAAVDAAEPAIIASLSPRMRMALRLWSQGRKRGDISMLLGYHPTRITQLAHSERGRAFIK
jgi:hypothetical protein